MGKSNTNNIGLAGEFAVLSRLLLHGYDVSITCGNTKGTDILAFHPESKNKYRVEVKTTENSIKKDWQFGKIIEWTMNAKHEQIKADDLFYCFVSVPESKNDAFRFFIIPSKVVADWIVEGRKLYAKGGRKVAKAKRGFRLGFKGASKPKSIPLAEDYENNWNFKA